MHIFQLISGTLFAFMTGASIFLAVSEKNNIFFAAALLFLIITVSCFILAVSRIRKKGQTAAGENTADDEEASEDNDNNEEVIGEADGEDAEQQTDPDKEITASDGEESGDAEQTDSEEETVPDGDPDPTQSPEDGSNPDEEPADTDQPDEEKPSEEPGDPSDFYKQNRTRLIQMDTEISLMNRRARHTEEEISQMTTKELEDAILHTQLAINAFNRMKIFCEANGTEGTRYFEERMQHHTEDPEFLSVEGITNQMNLLKSTYEAASEAEDSVQPEENKSDS